MPSPGPTPFSGEALTAWRSLSPDDRARLADWAEDPWTERSRRDRLGRALRLGPVGIAAFGWGTGLDQSQILIPLGGPS